VVALKQTTVMILLINVMNALAMISAKLLIIAQMVVVKRRNALKIRVVLRPHIVIKRYRPRCVPHVSMMILCAKTM
jgi:hypothetical protein